MGPRVRTSGRLDREGWAMNEGFVPLAMEVGPDVGALAKQFSVSKDSDQRFP